MMPMVMVMLWLNRAVVVDKEEEDICLYTITFSLDVRSAPNSRRT